MKKVNGFTLVELLGSIVLLALITTIISVTVISLINRSSSKVDEATQKLLFESVQQHIKKNSSTYKKTNGKEYYITIEQLIENNMVESDFLDTYSSKNLSKDTQIKVTVNNNQYNYDIPATQLNDIESFTRTMISDGSSYSYDDGTYLDGARTNNYVLYNGFMWRIMGVNNDDTIRLVLDQNITTMFYGANINYNDSNIREWLNNYFISHLKFIDIIKAQKWYYSNSGVSSITPDNTLYTTDKVGMLSIEEVNLSMNDGNSYLVIDDNYYLLNSTSSTIKNIMNNNSINELGDDTMAGVRPVINVLPSTIISDGTGIKTDPYILGEVREELVGATLFNANLSIGDYVNCNTKLFRVIDVGTKEIKLIDDIITSNSVTYLESGNSFNTINGLGYALNNSITHNNLITTNVFVGNPYLSSDNVMDTALAKKNIVVDVNVSAPKIGDILTSNPYDSVSSDYWTITKATDSMAYFISTNNQSVPANLSTNKNIRLVITISSNYTITGGIGTKENPYTFNN